MKRSLYQLEAFCTYNKNGCTWRGELGELQAHLKKTDHSGESLQPEYALTGYIVGYIVTIFDFVARLPRTQESNSDWLTS